MIKCLLGLCKVFVIFFTVFNSIDFDGGYRTFFCFIYFFKLSFLCSFFFLILELVIVVILRYGWKKFRFSCWEERVCIRRW